MTNKTNTNDTMKNVQMQAGLVFSQFRAWEIIIGLLLVAKYIPWVWTQVGKAGAQAVTTYNTMYAADLGSYVVAHQVSEAVTWVLVAVAAGYIYYSFVVKHR